MPIAELILDSSPSNFESFYFKATDQHTSLVVLVASKDQFKRVLDGAGGAPGLYILQAEDSTVYVGKSLDLAARLKNHKSNDKIGYRRVMLMMRDQGLSQYLDYGEAKLYETLKSHGFMLEQSPLSGSLDVKRQRLVSRDVEHVAMADGLVRQFLCYSVALGLTEPRGPKRESAEDAPPLSPIFTTSNTSLTAVKGEAPPNPEQTPAFVVSKKKLPPLRIKLTQSSGVELLPGELVATKVFLEAILKAGVLEVQALGLKLSGIALISDSPGISFKTPWREVGGKWVTTHSDTRGKAAVLREISTGLNLGWTIELGENA